MKPLRVVLLTGLALAAGLATAADSKRIVFLGDSLTAGYGLKPSQAYPALIKQKLEDADIEAEVVNAGVSGDTSSGGLRRINWLLKKRIDILVLALGANDGLRGQDVDATRENLQKIIDRTKEKYPDVQIVIAGMMVPPNLGKKYAAAFQSIFPTLAKKNDSVLIPFLLEGVAGTRKLNQADAIHPTAEGQKIIAETVWKHLKPLLKETSK